MLTASSTGPVETIARPTVTNLELRLASIRFAARNINLFEFVSPYGADLPPFSAGAHVDVTLPRGVVRPYSLCNNPVERGRYQVAVLRQSAGRGGAVLMHDELRCGTLVPISVPRNNFELDWSALRHTLVAGGIGITPMMAMLYELECSKAEYALHYCARTSEDMAFRETIASVSRRGEVSFYLDDGDPSRGLDVAKLVGAPYRNGEHVYVCGPPALIHAVRDAARAWPDASIHTEYFAPPAAAAGDTEGHACEPFEVVLARSGRSIAVGPGVSISTALERHGVIVPTSCEQGVCGTCVVTYLSGEPDHRDFVLSEAERAHSLITCCSRSRTAKLVLDL